MTAGDHLTLTIEKAAAGGRMIARHDGAVVLVAGAIPGEVVEATIEKVQRGTAWARTTRVVAPSPDRAAIEGDWACGGNVLAHVVYERQLDLKCDIIRDAFARIGRMPLPPDLPIAASPATGYRMRARLHREGDRLGFFREGTHQLCAAAAAGQLLPESLNVIAALEAALRAMGDVSVRQVELSENCPADERALHLSLAVDADGRGLAHLPAMPGVRGISTASGGRRLGRTGTPTVTDRIEVCGAAETVTITLTRQAHSFFQGNRYLLAALVAGVVDEVPSGRVLDLYAGVGLFSMALAASGGRDVTAVEGDAVSASDLQFNAASLDAGVDVRHESVEAFLRARRSALPDTVVVDPPRTGMTKEALAGVLALRPARVVYVSCDVATLARDARTLVDRGYQLRGVRAFDLFPKTAHVETLAVFMT